MCKEIKNGLTLSINFFYNLQKDINNITCPKCWSWGICRAKYLIELVNSAGSYVKKLCKLSTELIHAESKQMYQDVVNRKLNATIDKA